MKVVLDTNVLIDGFSDDFSAQARLLDAVRDSEIEALITPQIEREYQLILRRLINDPVYKEGIGDVLAQAKRVAPKRVDTEIDDPEDYKFLQAAVGGAADFLVTMDRHLLAVGEIGTTRIVSPQEAWAAWEEEGGGGSGAWADFVRGTGIG